jgi:hypothetical protein
MAPGIRAAFYSDAISIAANELKDPGRTIAYGRRTLSIDPANINVLLSLILMTPPRPDDAAQRTSIVEELIGYGHRIAEIERLPGRPQEQWEALKQAVQRRTDDLSKRGPAALWP